MAGAPIAVAARFLAPANAAARCAEVIAKPAGGCGEGCMPAVTTDKHLPKALCVSHQLHSIARPAAAAVTDAQWHCFLRQLTLDCPPCATYTPEPLMMAATSSMSAAAVPAASATTARRSAGSIPEDTPKHQQTQPSLDPGMLPSITKVDCCIKRICWVTFGPQQADVP
jgi:hypothetical protein